MRSHCLAFRASSKPAFMFFVTIDQAIFLFCVSDRPNGAMSD